MNDSYGTADLAKSEPSASSIADLPLHELANIPLDEIEETDIRVLVPYNWDSDGETLVGIGPLPSRLGRRSSPMAAGEPPRKSSPKAAEGGRKSSPKAADALRRSEPTIIIAPPPSADPASLQPRSEQPGPWGSDDEDGPPTVRTKKLGIWSVAVPALLVAAAGAAMFLRTLGTAKGHATQQPAVTNAAVAVKPTAGIAVSLKGVDVRVYLDGQDHGRPPLVVTGLTPGSHALSIVGPAFAPFEQPVTLVADHVSMIEPALTLVHGAIRIAPGENARGVNVEVVGENERRVVESLPARLDAAPGDYVVHARKAGYFPFDTNVQLSATTPEVDVNINLEKITPLASGPKPVSDSSLAPTGTLNITSSPPASVVLDGRPLGKSPRAVVMPAGSHTVVFIHPKFGRKSLTINVAADQTTNASVDF